ncbi:MAG: Plug domain-containing protein [Bacteroidota bacterium]
MALLFLVLPIVTCIAQGDQNTIGDEVRLVALLEQLEQKYKVSFSYNHTLFDKFILANSIQCSELSSCLEILQQVAPIKIETNGTSDFLILPVRKEASFAVVEQETGNLILPITIQINNQESIYLLPTGNQYSLPDLFTTDTIQISSRFHKTVTLSAKELLLIKDKLILEPETVYLSEVVVEGYLTSGVDTRLSDHSLQVDMKKLGLLAGETDSDILTVLKNIPGIRTPDGKPGSLNFRGSTFDQTLIHFDGIPIYHTGHFFGTISPYNPIAVDKVEIFRGTAPAKWGGRV